MDEGEGGVKPDRLKVLESKPLEEEALGRPGRETGGALGLMMSFIREKSVSILSSSGSSLWGRGDGLGLLRRDLFRDLSFSFFGTREGRSGLNGLMNVLTES